MYISSTNLLLPACLALQCITSATALVISPSPVPEPPTGYFMRSCGQSDCRGNNTLFDDNMHGDDSCQNVPSTLGGQPVGAVAVEAHNWCVNLYTKPDCKGARIVARSTNGACSTTNVVGTTFGGNGTSLPSWTVMSYIANAGDVLVPGTQLMPVVNEFAYPRCGPRGCDPEPISRVRS